MNDQPFSGERDAYIILKLPLDRYRGTERPLPDGYRIGPPQLDAKQRQQERALLRENFRNWEGPFSRQTPGWRTDTPVYVLHGEDLAGGLYLCAEHEFEEGGEWGQLHYFFVARGHKGKGLHSRMVGEAIRRAGQWGMRGVYINTDRFGLPEVWQRWGAEHWKTIPKASGPGQNLNQKPWNRLVFAIHDAALWQAVRRYARGVLVDIGCGRKPYAAMTEGMVTRHIGVDHPDTLHAQDQIDVFATAYQTTLPGESADTVLCTTVLEHLEDPSAAFREMYRILKPGGFLILTAPLFWHLHEEPRDFFRYTEFGLRHLLTESGLTAVRIQPLSGFIVTFAQEACYYLGELEHRLPVWIVRGLQRVLQAAAYRIHARGWDRVHRFTWCYLAVARKESTSA